MALRSPSTAIASPSPSALLPRTEAPKDTKYSSYFVSDKVQRPSNTQRIHGQSICQRAAALPPRQPDHATRTKLTAPLTLCTGGWANGRPIAPRAGHAWLGLGSLRPQQARPNEAGHVCLGEAHNGRSLAEVSDSESGIRSMRASAIKQELKRKGVSYEGVFEKEELVQRLLRAISGSPPHSPLSSQSPPHPPPLSSSLNSSAPPPLPPHSPLQQPSAPHSSTFRDALLVHTLPLEKVQSVGGEGREYVLLPLSLGTPNEHQSKRSCTHVDEGASAGVQQSTVQHRFVVDTGSSTTIVSPDFAYQVCGIPRGSGTPTQGLGGMGAAGKQGDQVLLPRLFLRSYECDQCSAIVMDLRHTGLPPSISGILGLNFLRQFEMDFDATQVSVYRQGAVAQGAVDLAGSAWALSASTPFGLPGIKISLNGSQPVLALLDMGSPLTLITSSAAAAASAETRSAPVQVLDVGGSTTQMGGAEVTLHILVQPHSGAAARRISFEKHRVVVGDLPALSVLGAGAVLGLDILLQMRCVMCFAENRLYFRRVT